MVKRSFAYPLHQPPPMDNPTKNHLTLLHRHRRTPCPVTQHPCRSPFQITGHRILTPKPRPQTQPPLQTSTARSTTNRESTDTTLTRIPGPKPRKLLLAPVDLSIAPPDITHPAFPDRGTESLHACVNLLAKSRRAASTNNTYHTRLKIFCIFCQTFDLIVPGDTTLPPGAIGYADFPQITPDLLCFYVAWLWKREHFTSYDSIVSYVTAIAAWCTPRGRPNPRIDPSTGDTDERYFAVCQGLRRSMGSPRPERYPITLWHLRNLTKGANELLPPLLALNVDAAAKFAFGLLLRVGEFTTGNATFDPHIHASRDDVTFVPSLAEPRYVRFRLKVSKTDQFRKSVTLILARADDPALCPVRALKRLFDADPQQPGSPLFNFNTDDAPRRVSPSSSSRTRFTDLCNKIFTYRGINNMHLKGHSYRQGGATALLAAGAPEWIIKTMGRWKSDCWHLYSCTDERHFENWGSSMFTVPLKPVDYTTTAPTRVIDYF
eukprot:m.419618 g.419618  ORF g.419618 m.419618 type:complete len:491 (-) comp16841_c0_seq1:179-1651(-)